MSSASLIPSFTNARNRLALPRSCTGNRYPYGSHIPLVISFNGAAEHNFLSLNALNDRTLYLLASTEFSLGIKDGPSTFSYHHSASMILARRGIKSSNTKSRNMSIIDLVTSNKLFRRLFTPADQQTADVAGATPTPANIIMVFEHWFPAERFSRTYNHTASLVSCHYLVARPGSWLFATGPSAKISRSGDAAFRRIVLHLCAMS